MSNVNIADKLEYVAYNIPRIYEQGTNNGYGLGYSDGESSGYSAGYEEGNTTGYNVGYGIGYDVGKDEGERKGYTDCYDAFWDSFQDNGNRNSYDYGVMGIGWNDETFKPKYKMLFVGKNGYIFGNTSIVDLRNCIDELDFTNSTDTNYIFRWSSIKYVPRVVMGEKTTINGTFPYAEKLETVEEIVLNDKNTNFPRFDFCYELREININGTIQRSIYLQDSSKLTTEDAINTIMHLKDYGADDANLYKYTISFHRDVWDRLDALGEVSPFGDTWQCYCVDLGWSTA